MIIRNSEYKAVLPEEVAAGNYFYVDAINGKSILCRVVGMRKMGVTITAATPGEQDCFYEGLPSIGCGLYDLNVVMITEEWFKMNSHVFSPAPDVIKNYDIPEYTKFLWSYLFKSKITPYVEYYVFGLSISYEDKDKEDELTSKGYSFLQAKEEASGKCTIVQVVAKNKSMPFLPISFMNVSALHHLQNFLTLCGYPDAFKVVPEELVEE